MVKEKTVRFLVLHTLTPNRVEVGVVEYPGRMKRGRAAVVLVARRTSTTTVRKTEQIVPTLNRLLKKAKIDLRDLTGIIVASGPGPFSATRSGVVVANTLAFALRIPAFGLDGAFSGVPEMVRSLAFRRIVQAAAREPVPWGKKFLNRFVRPGYGAPPHITAPVRRRYQQHRFK